MITLHLIVKRDRTVLKDSIVGTFEDSNEQYAKELCSKLLEILRRIKTFQRLELAVTNFIKSESL